MPALSLLQAAPSPREIERRRPEANRFLLTPGCAWRVGRFPCRNARLAGWPQQESCVDYRRLQQNQQRNLLLEKLLVRQHVLSYAAVLMVAVWRVSQV